jgi:hypothetical protein
MMGGCVRFHNRVVVAEVPVAIVLVLCVVVVRLECVSEQISVMSMRGNVKSRSSAIRNAG